MKRDVRDEKLNATCVAPGSIKSAVKRHMCQSGSWKREQSEDGGTP